MFVFLFKPIDHTLQICYYSKLNFPITYGGQNGGLRAVCLTLYVICLTLYIYITAGSNRARQQTDCRWQACLSQTCCVLAVGVGCGPGFSIKATTRAAVDVWRMPDKTGPSLCPATLWATLRF